MFDVVGAGQAIIFVSVLAALAIIAPLWLCYASHCFLVVIAESSIGDPEVRWPDETVADWWWKPVYCLFLLSAWASAGGLILSPLLLVSPWLFAAGGVLYLWYAFPVGLLCVMDARNSLALLHLPLIMRLVRYSGSVLLVGLLTLPLGLAVGGLVTATALY